MNNKKVKYPLHTQLTHKTENALENVYFEKKIKLNLERTINVI